MKAWFTENLLLKLIALLLTLVLHLVVNEDKVEVGVFFVEVVSTVPDDSVLLEQPIERISVSIRGKRSSLTRIRDRALEPIMADLSEAIDDVYQFRPGQIDLPAGLEVISINPSTMPVRLDVRRRTRVPVVARVEGSPAPGYKIVGQQVFPDEVEVLGPSTRLADTIALTEALDLSDRERTVEQMVELRDPAATGVEFRPSSVRLVVKIEPVRADRTFEEVPIVVRNTRYDTLLTPNTVSLTVTGPPKTIWGLDGQLLSVYVDATVEDGREPGTRLKTLKVDNLPEDVRVKNLNPATVELTTQTRPSDDEEDPLEERRDDQEKDGPSGPEEAP